MAAFRDTSVPFFVQQNRDNGNLWLFLHIPKTAGSSLSVELARAMAPYRNIHVDYANKEIPARLQKQGIVDQFIADAQTTPFRSASGHITMRHALQIRSALPRVKIVTFLRDPVNRVISDFRYQTTPAHPPYKQFIARFPRIEDYIKEPRARNKMFRFLTTKQNTPFEEAIRTIEKQLTFVGTLESYPMCFNILFRLFGVNLKPEEHRRKTEANEHNRISRGDDLRSQIRSLNGLDVALYEHFQGLLDRRAKEWAEMQNFEVSAEFSELSHPK
jgi:hypothetical protein